MVGIEKGIPLPDSRTNQSHRRKVYPFAAMGEGDSFFLPAAEGRAKDRRAMAIRTALKYYRDTTGDKASFAVHRVDGGVRCWKLG